MSDTLELRAPGMAQTSSCNMGACGHAHSLHGARVRTIDVKPLSEPVSGFASIELGTQTLMLARLRESIISEVFCGPVLDALASSKPVQIA
ncbi:MAG: hypothetical protein K2X27_26130 [Candidatus Obscuribacterales bacterium]|nr:hypothetical protein [Candidatus Obscuribacterales bacterium]